MTDHAAAKIPLILHIGMHKTGSSSLQSFLAKNSDKLVAQNVLYPKCCQDYLNGHHALAYSLGMGRPDYCEQWKSWKRPRASELADEMRSKGCNRILMSSEVFCMADDHSTNKLKEYLKDFDVSILIYLRRPDMYLCSLYAEQTKTVFATDDISILTQRTKHPRYNYLNILKRYSNTFGQENVMIRPFERQQMPDGLYADFMQGTACKMDDTFRSSDSKSDNVSFTPEVTELIRFFNKHITKKVLHWRVRQILRDRPGATGKSPLGQVSLPANLQQEVIERTQQDSETIARDHLNRPDGKLFYESLPEKPETCESTTHLDSVIKVLESELFPYLLNNGLLGPHITRCIDFFLDHVASSLIDIQEWDLDASTPKSVTFEPSHQVLKLNAAYIEIESNSTRSAKPIVKALDANGKTAQKWTCYIKTEKGFLFGPKDNSVSVVEKIRINRLKGLTEGKVRLTRLFTRDS